MNDPLNYLIPVFTSYRNQSIHLKSDSTDWSLNDGNSGIK